MAGASAAMSGGMTKEQAKYWARLYRDPGYWHYDMFGQQPTWQQAQLFEAIKSGKLNVAIKSGHGTGKSSALASLLLWFLSTRENALIPCTAPSAHQMHDVLWAEVARYHAKMREPWKSQIEWTRDKIRHKTSPEFRYAVARTSRAEKPEALAGFHSEQLLFLIDEASGVPDVIFQTAEGALSTPGAMVIMISNPTRRSGEFYRIFKEQDPDYVRLTFNSEQSPLVTDKYLARMAKYGKDSSVYRIRVLGEFAEEKTNTLIPFEWVDDATNRWHECEKPTEGAVIFGLDPAGPNGDETSLVVRCGTYVEKVWAWTGYDEMQTVSLGRQIFDQYGKRTKAICIDTIGIGGGIASRLKELGYPVVPIQGSWKSTDQKGVFKNIRAQYWWALRSAFQEGAIAIPDTCTMNWHEEKDDELAAQLSTIEYKTEGKIQIQSKPDYRKDHGGRSPDRADALMLTFCDEARNSEIYSRLPPPPKQHAPDIFASN